MSMEASSISGVGYGEAELYSNKEIDMSGYNTICFDMDYSVVFVQDAWRTNFGYGVSDKKVWIGGKNESSSGQIIKMDISNLTNPQKVYFKVYSAAAGAKISVTVRRIWLE